MKNLIRITIMLPLAGVALLALLGFLFYNAEISDEAYIDLMKSYKYDPCTKDLYSEVFKDGKITRFDRDRIYFHYDDCKDSLKAIYHKQRAEEIKKAEFSPNDSVMFVRGVYGNPIMITVRLRDSVFTLNHICVNKFAMELIHQDSIRVSAFIDSMKKEKENKK